MTKLLSDGDQLLLPLKGLVSVDSLPWGGRSPRVLTRGHEVIILKAQAEKSMSAVFEFGQCALWPTAKEPPPHIWGGSPSLLPLLEVSHG